VIKANLKVTLIEDRSNAFLITHFHLKPLLLNKTASIIDLITRSVLAVLLKKIVLETLLILIEKITTKHRETVKRKTKVENMKGKHLLTKFRFYVQHRGSGAI
jgi:hypothetical protein